MALTPGTRVGAFEITGELGAGGMGEVYRARDSKLKREVAIKVLPANVAGDPERLARFQREAEVLASLNHPNIAHVYGVEAGALVMELVEGDDLAQRLARGPIAIDEALPIARQIADALEAAHEAGIVHRDLKPANVKARDDGTVKVLDFGLAKALEQGAGIRAQESGSLANSPTITSPALTMRGVILGTAAYMSPEQAKGKPVDKRADIWAFGCVLYEMLTGQRAFRGEDATDTIAEVLKSNVDFSTLPASTPAPVRRLLERCLERDPRARLRDIGEARIALQAPPAAEPPPAGQVRRGLSYAAAAMVAIAAMGVAGGGMWTLRRAVPATPRSVARVSWPYADGRSLRLVVPRQQLALSRNGRVMAGLGNTIWVKPMSQLSWINVPGTADATSVFASPDGEWVGYLTRLAIGKVRAGGGSTTQVVSFDSSDAGPIGASWSDDGRIFFSNATGIHAVSANGGAIETIVAAADVSVVQVLPGSEALLYSRGRPNQRPEVVLRGLKSAQETVLAEGLSPRFVSPDLVLWVNGTTVSGARVDVASRKLLSPHVSLLDDVTMLAAFAQFDVADDGTAVYVPASTAGQPRSTLALRTRGGQLRSLHPSERQFSDPRVSPDGRRLALHISDDDNDVWVFDLERGALTRLSFHAAEDETPAWSPDGQWIAFSGQSRAGNARSVFRRRADGSGVEEVLWTGAEHTHVTDWLPDGRALLLEASHPERRADVLLLDLTAKTVAPVIATGFNESSARLSPNGRWVAYQSDESGRFEIYVQSFPGLDRKIQVSTRGGVQPVWSRDGTTLYFRTETTLESSRFHDASGSARPDAPVTLFEDKFVQPQGATHTTYDVMPDGSLIVFQPLDRFSASWLSTSVIGIFNWLEEVRQKLPSP